MTTQTMKIMPTTTLGKWSVGLIITMPILIIVGSTFTNALYESVPSGNTILADIAARPALALSMLAGMTAGIAAFITALVAVIRRERALLVYVAGIIGALLLVFLSGEILFPH